MTTPRVYLDNAASTPMAPEVFEAMRPYFTDFYGNPSSIHAHGRQLRAAIEQARRTVADLLGCAPGEIIFTSGGTEALNFAIKGSVLSRGVRRIITSPLEHHAVLHSVETAAKCHDLSVTMLTPDTQGRLSLDELNDMLKQSDEQTLVALMHGNNEIGTMNDIAAIGEICRSMNALYLSDTVQTMGHAPIALAGLDFATASAHKFHGPKGVGFLYCAPDARPMPLLCGGGQERNQRAGTENVAAIVGLAKALELMMGDFEAHVRHLCDLKQYFAEQLLARIPGVAFNGVTDLNLSLPTVLNVAFPGEDEESLLLFQLDLQGISASGGSACTSGADAGSHVLKALGLPAARIANSARFSFGRQTTREDLDYTLDVLTRLLMPQMQSA